MTIEEKARAYDEAIGKAQAVFHTSEVIKITDLFPVLKESEDERMLQTIIRGFENWKSNGKETFNFTNVDDILAYLEKQKEQKDYRKLYEDIAQSEWFKKAYAGKSLGEEFEQKERKPAEWSDENYDKISKQVYKAIRRALASLAVYAENEALLDSKEETLSYYSQQCAEKILKSLRPDSYKNCNSRWKPSEEQIKALQCAIVFMAIRKASDYDITPLKSLYEHLKRL